MDTMSYVPPFEFVQSQPRHLLGSSSIPGR